MTYLFEEFCADCVFKRFCSGPCVDVVQFYKDNADRL